jgi:signal transduction histidine kinase
MRWPIRYQILLPYTAVVLFTLIVSTLFNAYFASQAIERQIQQQLLGIAETLSNSSFPFTDTVLAQIKGLSGAEFVLCNERNVVVAASRRWSSTPPLPYAEGARLGKLELGSRVELDGSNYLQATVRLVPRNGSARALSLHVFLPEGQWQALRWQAALPSLVIGSLSLVLVVLCAVMIATRIGRPIHRLRVHLGTLAEGRFELLPLPARNDELRDLFVSTNSLAQQLDEMRHTIQLSERMSVLGQLSAGLAHQLRNHVTGAKIALQLHGRKCGADPQSADVALRQLSLTEECLKGFLAAGKPIPPRRIRCRLKSVLDELDLLLRPAFRHRNVTFTIEPGAALDNWIEIDPDQVRQALTNLVVNALDAVGENGQVRIECETLTGPATAVRVMDNGSGLPPGRESELFEPFATSKPEGVGLGLAVAKQIAEAHQGALRYYRRQETTCFELILPHNITVKHHREACAATSS